MTQHIALQPQRRRASLNSTVLVAIVAVAVALLVAGAAWLVLVKPSGSGKSDSAATTPGAHAATAGGLVSAAASLGHPIYWAGKRSGMTYELTITKKGNAYVRYLTAGVKPGDKRPDFVTVGTYPQANAFAVLSAAHKIESARIQTLPGGELAVSYPTRPKSVYLAKRGSQYMIEVFAPVRNGAETLVRNGLIVPVQ